MTSIVAIPAPLSIAPMMERTDRHYRFFMRQLTRRALVYTEMVHASAVVLGDRHKLLGYDPAEHPLVVQLGGDDPRSLAEAARIAADWGYDEINLNVGCPSERVRSGNFGACLMTQPDRVARCVEAMRAAVPVPVGVKQRIGVDGHESYEFMATFVRTVAAAGCDRFIVHARIAVLSGLSPRANRTIPPLRYADVHRLKAEHPHLRIELNGGIRDLAEARAHLDRTDGVMVGRAAYDDPFAFAGVDAALYGDDRPAPGRPEVIAALCPYAERHLAAGGRLHAITRHLHGLFAGQPGARAWRRFLSERVRPDSGVDVLREAAERMASRSAA